MLGHDCHAVLHSNNSQCYIVTLMSHEHQDISNHCELDVFVHQISQTNNKKASKLEKKKLCITGFM